MRKKRKSSRVPRSDTSYKEKKVEKIKRAGTKSINRVPKTRNNGKWTEAMYFQKIRSSLRNGFRWWSPAMEALKRASRPSEDKSNKRLKTQYQCAQCKSWLPRVGVQVDHIEECGSLNCYEDIVPFLQKLTKEDIDSYQVLCKPCHKEKTKAYQLGKKGSQETAA